MLAKHTTKVFFSTGSAWRFCKNFPGILSMKTVSFFGFRASRARCSEIRRNSSFSTGRQLNSSLTCPTSAVCSGDCKSMHLKLAVSGTHTRYCLPHVRLPFFALLSSPSLALHGFVQSRAVLAKRRHSIFCTRDVLFCENESILCHVRGVYGVDRLLLQGVVFGDVLIIGALVKPQANLRLRKLSDFWR